MSLLSSLRKRCGILFENARTPIYTRMLCVMFSCSGEDFRSFPCIFTSSLSSPSFKQEANRPKRSTDNQRLYTDSLSEGLMFVPIIEQMKTNYGI